MEVCCGDIRTKDAYQDFKLHVEFRVPLLPDDVTGQDRGNSGIYLQERYELQILDSYGDTTLDTNEAGAIYQKKAAGRERGHGARRRGRRTTSRSARPASTAAAARPPTRGSRWCGTARRSTTTSRSTDRPARATRRPGGWSDPPPGPREQGAVPQHPGRTTELRLWNARRRGSPGTPWVTLFVLIATSVLTRELRPPTRQWLGVPDIDPADPHARIASHAASTGPSTGRTALAAPLRPAPPPARDHAEQAQLEPSVAGDYLALLEAVFLLHRLPPGAGRWAAESPACPRFTWWIQVLRATCSGSQRDALPIGPRGTHRIRARPGNLCGRRGTASGQLARRNRADRPLPHPRPGGGRPRHRVLRRPDGRREVKASSRVTEQDLRGLRMLRDKLGAPSPAVCC